MTRHGKTSAGRQRWRCRACGGSQITAIDATAKHLTEFLAWLLSRDRQVDMPGAGRSFRRRTAQFWRLWPMPVVVDEIHDVGCTNVLGHVFNVREDREHGSIIEEAV